MSTTKAFTTEQLDALRQVIREELSIHADPFYDADIDALRLKVKEGIDSLDRDGPLPGPETMTELRAPLKNPSKG